MSSVNLQGHILHTTSSESEYIGSDDYLNMRIEEAAEDAFGQIPALISTRKLSLPEQIDIPSVERKMVDIVMFRQSLDYMRTPSYRGIFAKHLLTTAPDLSFVDVAFYNGNIDAIRLLREFGSPFLDRLPKLILGSVDSVFSENDVHNIEPLRCFIFDLISDDLKSAVNLLRYFLVEYRIQPHESVSEPLLDFYRELFMEIKRRYMITSKLILLDLDRKLFTYPGFIQRAELMQISRDQLKSYEGFCLLL